MYPDLGKKNERVPTVSLVGFEISLSKYIIKMMMSPSS